MAKSIKWEYLTETIYDFTYVRDDYSNNDYKEYYYQVDRLNELGEQGWELVGVHENSGIFKRPKK